MSDRPTLTARQVYDWIGQRLDKIGDSPVHLLDMDEAYDDADIDNSLDGLATDIEWDVFSDEQGEVVSLLAWQTNRPEGSDQ
jgi:hypothetical protein